MKPRRTRSFAPSTRRPATAVPIQAAAAARPNWRRVRAVMVFSLSFVTAPRQTRREAGDDSEYLSQLGVRVHDLYGCLRPGLTIRRLGLPWAPGPLGAAGSTHRTFPSKEREWKGTGSVVAKRCDA